MNQKRYLDYMYKCHYPTNQLHQLMKEWVSLQEKICPVCNLYGDTSPFECICNDIKAKQDIIIAKLKNLL